MTILRLALIAALLVLITTTKALGRIGETKEELIARYGPPLEFAGMGRTLALMTFFRKNGISITPYFNQQGQAFEISFDRGTYIDPAVAKIYKSEFLSDNERDILLEANSMGQKWEVIPGIKDKWVLSDRSLFATMLNPNMGRDFNRLEISLAPPTTHYLPLKALQNNEEICIDFVKRRFLCVFFPSFTETDTLIFAKLNTLYEKHEQLFAIIVVAPEKSDQELANYQEKHHTNFPTSTRKDEEGCIIWEFLRSELLGVSPILVMAPNGNTVTKSGEKDLLENVETAFEKWTQAVLADIEQRSETERMKGF